MSSDTLAKIPVAPDVPERADALRIVPQRRFGQWGAAGVVLALLGLAANSVLRNKAFQWDVVADCFTSDSVLRGLWLTLCPAAVVMVLGFALGALYAAFRLSVEVAVVGLTLHEAAYAAEVVRGGILSVDRGQIEAAQAFGLSRWWRIVPPQAMRSIVPLGVGRYYVEKPYARGSERAR